MITTDGRAEFRTCQRRRIRHRETDRDLGPMTKLDSVGSGRQCERAARRIETGSPLTRLHLRYYVD
jgi:hypothetical protein